MIEVAVQFLALPKSVDRTVLRSLTRHVVREALGERDVPAEISEVGVTYVDDETMHDLNMRYREIDKPTDVLAFSMREGEDCDPSSPLLGDVVISLDTARRQAEEAGHTLRREVAVLLIHGTLHLLGFDHGKATETRGMRTVERACLSRLEDELVI
jgi:probable rRNA maturation factor